MKKKANFFAIGIFVIAAAVIAGASVILFGSGSLTKETTTLLAIFQGSANGLREGAKVKAYGVEIGSVEKVMLHKHHLTSEILIPTFLEIDLTKIRILMDDEKGLTFDEKAYQEAIEKGLYAKLQMQSAVTGQLYVDLKYGLDREGFMIEDHRFAKYRAVPTVPTDRQILRSSLQSTVQNLGKTDIAGLVDSLKGMVNDIRGDLDALDFKSIGSNLNGLLASSRNTVESPDVQKAIAEAGRLMVSYREFGDLLNRRADETVDRVDATLTQTRDTFEQIETAAASADVWLDPNSSIYPEVVDAIDQITDTARSLRILIDYMERNPSAFITGKKTEEAQP